MWRLFRRKPDLLQEIFATGHELRIKRITRGHVYCELPDIEWHVKATDMQTALRCARNKIDATRRQT